MPDKTGLNVITLPQYFKQNGYYTVGGGKIFHPGKSSGGPSSSEGGADEPYRYQYLHPHPALPPSPLSTHKTHKQLDRTIFLLRSVL